ARVVLARVATRPCPDTPGVGKRVWFARNADSNSEESRHYPFPLAFFRKRLVSTAGIKAPDRLKVFYSRIDGNRIQPVIGTPAKRGFAILLSDAAGFALADSAPNRFGLFAGSHD